LQAASPGTAPVDTPSLKSLHVDLRFEAIVTSFFFFFFVVVVTSMATM
jgi:hypothetical protein